MLAARAPVGGRRWLPVRCAPTTGPGDREGGSKVSVVIENARIVDGLGNPAVPGNVRIEEGRIAAVGGAEVLAATPAGTRRIDARGATVMPGLIDAHCHITFDEPSSNDELFFHRRPAMAAIVSARNVKKLLRAGVTGFMDADCIFDIGVDLRDAIAGGVLEGPRMATGGYALLTSVGGTAGALIPDSGPRGYAMVVRSPDEIRTEVRRQVKLGVDWIKVHVTGLIQAPSNTRRQQSGEVQAFTLDELKLVCDTAHELGVPVTGHCRSAASIRDAVLAGFDMILHATFMDEPTLALVIERKVPLVPTFTFQANLADFGDRVGADVRLKEIFRREIADSAVQLRQAFDAGVPVLCGTESGFSLTPYGDWHYRELEVFVDALGLTPLQAIRCATYECGRAIGLQDRVGAIAPGMLADLLVIDGEPDRDVRVLGERQRLRHVFVGGREADLVDREPERTTIPGWRVAPYSQGILRKGDG
jgi:imidazolonepropionase-like amidohydrolase